MDMTITIVDAMRVEKPIGSHVPPGKKPIENEIWHVV